MNLPSGGLFLVTIYASVIYGKWLRQRSEVTYQLISLTHTIIILKITRSLLFIYICQTCLPSRLPRNSIFSSFLSTHERPNQTQPLYISNSSFFSKKILKSINTITMKSYFFISSFLLLFFFFSPISAFPHFFTNISQNIPNITLPTAWESFKNLSGCQNGDKLDGLAKVKQYFQQFGYLNNSNTNYTDDFDDLLESALKTYQKNFNLNTTGVLDNSTLDHIVLPRCGVADIVNGTSSMNSHTSNTSKSGAIHSVAHYSFFPSQPRWPPGKRDLTYAFAPENQLSDTVKTVFARAFAKWAAVTPLTFQESDSYSTADITIGFYGGNHGDGEPFDGILGTLAHAFSPPDGRFHLDEAENWVVEGDVLSSAIDLESVAVHEIGHLLGLGHSSVEEAIMYPTISTGVKKVQLAQDDRDGVQELYGSNPNYDGTDTSTTKQEGDRSDGGILLCVGNFKWGMVLAMVGVLLLV